MSIDTKLPVEYCGGDNCRHEILSRNDEIDSLRESLRQAETKLAAYESGPAGRMCRNPGQCASVTARAEKAEAEVNALSKKLTQAVACLEWLDKLGGLGLDVHATIHRALGKTSVLNPKDEGAKP